jgi:hypothetical protein
MAKKVIHEETMCCGYKRCPTVRVFSDGSIEIADDDARAGSVGTIKIKPKSAGELLRILQEHAQRR